MNYRMIGKISGMVLLCLAALMLLPLAAALCFGESARPFLLSIALTGALGRVKGLTAKATYASV